MAKLKGTLLSDLRPNGKVRIVFHVGERNGNEPIISVKNLDQKETVALEFFPIRSTHKLH
jgi:hypothetical protein